MFLNRSLFNQFSISLNMNLIRLVFGFLLVGIIPINPTDGLELPPSHNIGVYLHDNVQSPLIKKFLEENLATNIVFNSFQVLNFERVLDILFIVAQSPTTFVSMHKS